MLIADVHKHYGEVIEQKEKYIDNLLHLLNQKSIALPDDLAEQAPPSYVNSSTSFLKIHSNFINHSWIKDIKKPPTMDEVWSWFSQEKVIICRGFCKAVGIDKEEFDYRKMPQEGHCK